MAYPVIAINSTIDKAGQLIKSLDIYCHHRIRHSKAKIFRYASNFTRHYFSQGNVLPSWEYRPHAWVSRIWLLYLYFININVKICVSYIFQVNFGGSDDTKDRTKGNLCWIPKMIYIISLIYFRILLVIRSIWLKDKEENRTRNKQARRNFIGFNMSSCCLRKIKNGICWIFMRLLKQAKEIL